METCHRCGTVLPNTPGARYCPNCGEMSAPVPPAASDATQAFAAVGAVGQREPSAPPEGGMTWALPPRDEPTPNDPTQAIPTQSGPPEPDPYAHLYRPEGGASRANPNATQVMPPVAADFGRSGYDQPAYDQPIDYQSGGGGAYAEPYEGGYADDYPGEQGQGLRSNRGAKIGIGVAAGAVLVIVVSLITLGGNSSTPTAAPGGTQGSVTTPSSTPSSASSAPIAPISSAPSSSASSPSRHVSDPAVKWLQARLKQLGLYNGPINGTYDATTRAAVVAFQDRTHPADPSGAVGRSTKTALIAAGSKPTLMFQLPGQKHRKGGSAADVKRLQEALAVALNANVKPTGQFDMDTFSAVVRYQSAMNLTPDGIANGQVWTALQQGRITG